MAYVDSTTNSGTSSTPSTAVPVGVQANDEVFLAFGMDSNAINVQAGDLPTGFTALNGAGTTINAPDGQGFFVAWKRLTGADSGSYTFGSVLAVETQTWVCQAIAFRGRDTGNPPVIGTITSNTTGNSSPVTVTAPSVTALAGDDLLWISAPDVTASGVGSGHTPPTNYTEAEDGELSWANLSLAYRENVSAGATGSISGTFTLTGNTSGWMCCQIRIPAAAAGGAFNAVPNLYNYYHLTRRYG